jgi:tetratricopeptide (TPR) repeat protein
MRVREVASVVVATAFALLTDQSTPTVNGSALEAAQNGFYNGRFDEAAELTREPCLSTADGLAACEIRTSALLFRIKRLIGPADDKSKALKACGECPDLMAAFREAELRGQALARERLRTHEDEEATLFLLGKIDLNHVWLHLGTLGRKTGWDEYWEARRALDKVLKKNPTHVRARVARAWIDYIVATKMPRGTRWMLGGGNKKRGLRAVREAAATDAGFFVRAEALFALWDMQVREGEIPEALATARKLARDFPENQEIAKFIETHSARAGE